MSLVTPKDVSSLLKIKKLGFLGNLISWLILKITKLRAINDHYIKHKDKSCSEFVDICLNDYKINFKIPKKDLKNIPKDGAYRMGLGDEIFKKYIKQNTKVIAFNIDPLFNNAVDGLMYIKIADLLKSTIKPLLEEVELITPKQSSPSTPQAII